MILIYTVMVFIDIVFISTRLKEESHSQKASYEVITVKLRMSRVRELSKKNLEIESR